MTNIMKKTMLSALLWACTLMPAWAQYPQWFSDAKLGIMVHYGLYSLPSYSGKEQYAEWFYKGLISDDTLRINFQKRVYGEDFQYFDYMRLFRAELFDAQEWTRLFREAGARYIVFTTKHHDGFCLYPSRFTSLNVSHTPAGRDLVGELCQAARKDSLHVGLYYSLPEWTNPLFRWTIDTDTAMLRRYVTQHLQPQFREIIDLYRPELLFLDGDWDFTADQLRTRELAAYHRQVVGANAIVNNRVGKGWDYGYLTPEYSSGIQETDRPWAECRSIARSFGLNRASALEDYQSADELVRHFAQLVSLGGGLMLNVAPAADGRIPLLQQERLKQLGQWLALNGEAIYGARSAGLPMQTRRETRHRTDSLIDFDWVRNGPCPGATEDAFHITWNGTLQVDKAQEYTFMLDADDSASLCLARATDTLLLSAATSQQPLRRTLRLEPGQYALWVDYTERDVDASCHLRCAVADGPEAPLRSATGWQAEISWNTPEVCFTANHGNLYAIALRPLGDSLVLQLPARQGGGALPSVRLLGCDKTLPCAARNGSLTVDLTPLRPRDVLGQHAWVFKISQ